MKLFRRALIITILLSIILSGINILINHDFKDKITKTIKVDNIKAKEIKPNSTKPIIEIKTKSNYYCLIDENGNIVSSKNEYTKIYPASTTKLVTAMVAYDNLNENDYIKITNVIKNMPPESSTSGLIKNDKLKVKDLTYALMLPSGNDAAIVIAIETAKKVTKNDNISYEEGIKIFAKLMNKKVKQIGAKNTNFVNPHGYYSSNHYSTAYDMALIAKEILKYPKIQEIVSKKEYYIKQTKNNHEYLFKTHNELIMDKNYYYKYANGIKTGYTDEGKHTLIASAKKNNKYLFVSIFKLDKREERAIVAKKLFEYGFNK